MKSKKRIYLDYAAMTPASSVVQKAMRSYFDESYSNPSSVHQSGRKAREALEEARSSIARTISAKKEEIIFTASGTESCNLALCGAARASRDKGNHIIVSAIEHKAVLEPARQLEQEGFDVSYLSVGQTGLIDIDEYLSLVTDETVLISIMYANNEVGTVQPIRKLAQALERHRSTSHAPLLHTDACQAFNYLRTDVEYLGIDLLTLNGTKVYGPKGVGLLYVRAGTSVSPVILGGTQERGLRAGTQNVPAAVGFAAALTEAKDMRESEYKRLQVLRKYCASTLKEKIPSAIVNGHTKEQLPNIVHVSVPGIDGETAVLLLDEQGIEVSTGAACSSFDLEPSHVLTALGLDKDLIRGSIRFSFGRYTTKEDIDATLHIFTDVVEKLSSY